MPPRKKHEPQQTAFIKTSPPPVKNGDILDVDEAAALLKVSKKTLYNRVKNNRIPHARLGRKLLFSRAKLTQWVSDGLTWRSVQRVARMPFEHDSAVTAPPKKI